MGFFATIMAVVAGLAISAASAISYDLYANVLGGNGERREMLVSRIATLAIGVISIVLGVGFEQQNIAYLVGLAFGIAAAANFPVLLLCMYWPGLTTRGAIIGGTSGLVGSAVLTVLGPSIWVKMLGYPAPVFPYDPPAIVTIPLAFLLCWLVSRFDRSPQGMHDRQSFVGHGVLAAMALTSRA